MRILSSARLCLRRASLGAALATVLFASTSGAQRAAPPSGPSLLAADSTLIYEILTAEEQRDADAAALRNGAVHRDSRVRLLAKRALARISDSTFAARDSLGQPDSRPIPNWALPVWAERFRRLSGRTVGCDTLFRAVADSAIQVRLRALALAGNQQACRSHPEMLSTLRGLVNAIPTAASSRRPPNGSWHESAAALVGYALLAPDSARPHIRRFSNHGQPQLRRAAARAAVAVRDTTTLLHLSVDNDGNVAEAAIQGLARLVGHAYDELYISRMAYPTPQVALAAAVALKGSTHPDAHPAVQRELERVTARNIASERDVRSALRAVLGDSSPEPWALRQAEPLPRDVIALALGESRYIEVVMSRLHGGGSFTVELRGDVAPIMAARVLARARAGGYNGQRWHRVEAGFVIQGGSRADNEYAGSEFFLVDELASIPHPRGSVGMSTRGHDTGDAQWFVNLRDNARLMGDYTVFGMVVAGMDVVDGVLEGDEFYLMREVSAPRRPNQP